MSKDPRPSLLEDLTCPTCGLEGPLGRSVKGDPTVVRIVPHREPGADDNPYCAAGNTVINRVP